MRCTKFVGGFSPSCHLHFNPWIFSWSEGIRAFDHEHEDVDGAHWRLW